jgi:hypothetical protein
VVTWQVESEDAVGTRLLIDASAAALAALQTVLAEHEGACARFIAAGGGALLGAALRRWVERTQERRDGEGGDDGFQWLSDQERALLSPRDAAPAPPDGQHRAPRRPARAPRPRPAPAVRGYSARAG